jgi:hypothetical protein
VVIASIVVNASIVPTHLQTKRLRPAALRFSFSEANSWGDIFPQLFFADEVRVGDAGVRFTG